MPDKHAYLSASSAERWIHCPGSARVATLFPESRSPVADEGTLAHELAATMIQYNAEQIGKVEYEATTARIRDKVEKFYAEHTDLKGSFEVMQKILEPYITYVWEEHQAAIKADAAAVIMTEQRVSFEKYVPEGFGTSDVVIIGGGKATIIDLKYGKGVPVSAVGNPQIRLYALGAIDAYDILYDFDTVKLVIYQPRKDSVTDEEMSVKELQDWAEKVVAPAAKEAAGDNAPCHAGPWCDSHFCPAAGSCKARAEYILEIERHSGKDPALLSDEELGDVLKRLDSLQSFTKKVQDYALNSIDHGHPIKGWKIIEGQSRRTYKDPDAVAAAAIKAGYKEALLYERNLIGITKMEDLMGKKEFEKVLGGLVIKPAGKPKLAPESDPHPAFNSAASDFAD